MFGTCVPDTVLNAGYPHVKTSSAVKKNKQTKKKPHSLFEENEKSTMSIAFGDKLNYQLRKFTLAVHVISYIKGQLSEVKLV